MPADRGKLPTETPEGFLYRSMRILDSGDLEGWLATCDENLSYIVNTLGNIGHNYPVAVIQDDFTRLKGRIQSIVRFWHAETPRTHVLHMVTNVETERTAPDAATVHSCFMVTATRRDRQARFMGRYTDTLVVKDGTWKLRSRLAVIENDMLDGGKITFII